MMINPAEYTISIRRGVFDGEDCFEARVKELPDVSEYGDSYEEVYQLAIDTIETTALIYSEKGKQMPAPIKPVDDFSGRVTLRLSKTLHRDLVYQAEEEGVSLNQHIVNSLSYGVGFSKGVITYKSAASWTTLSIGDFVRSHEIQIKDLTTGSWSAFSSSSRKTIRPISLKEAS